MKNDVRQEAVSRLFSAVAAKTEDVLREAVTRFFGHDKWHYEELKNRGVMQHLSSGVEVFYIDGVALLELYPLTVEHEAKSGRVVIKAMRNHRFLVPNEEVSRKAT